MNTNELRLGNWIWSTHGQYDRIESKVMAIHLGYVNTTYDNSKSELRYIEPIPLTEEWLLKFGFKGLPIVGWYGINSKPMIKGRYVNSGLFEVQYGRAYIKIQHVHHLQNLFYSFVGEELTIKDQ